MPSISSRAATLPYGWLAAVTLVFLAHVLYLNTVAEDAFIALRFATNLASGHGLVWNPGASPVEGYTDFLWVVLCALAMRVGLPGVGFAQFLSITAGIATVWLTCWAGRRLMRWPTAVALVPAGLLAVAGPIAAWASSGMESTLFAFLALLSACQFGLFWAERRTRSLVQGAIALVLAMLTRPEGLLIAIILLALSFGAALAWRRAALVPLSAALGIFAAAFGAYVLWRYSYFGYLLPNTFYAKTGGGWLQVLRGGLLAYLFLMQFGVPLLPAGLMAVWEAGLPSVSWRRDREAAATTFERNALAIFAAGIALGYTVYNVLVGGDYMAMHRFFVPVLPFLYLLFGLVIAVLHARMTRRENVYGLTALLGFTALATFFPSTVLERSFFASPPQQHGNYRGVQIERWHVARLSVIGRFFRGYRRDPSESLATTAIGAIGYYSDMRVYDIHGLVDTHIAHMPPPPDFGRLRPGHGRKDLPYTFSLEPTYVMFSRDLTPAPIELWRYIDNALRPVVERDYVHRAVWLVDDANGQRGYFTFLERRDSAARRPVEPAHS